MSDGSTEASRYRITFTDALTELSELGLVALVDAESAGMPRAALTDAGAARFEQLCQIALGVSVAKFMACCRRFGVDEPGP